MYWLKELRKKEGKTLFEMAESIGVSKSLYEKIEYGDRTPSTKFIVKFRNAFPNIDINLFFVRKTHD